MRTFPGTSELCKLYFWYVSVKYLLNVKKKRLLNEWFKHWTHADNTDTAVIIFCQGPDNAPFIQKHVE